MKQFKNIATTILEKGTWKTNRTGIKTLSYPIAHFRHDMSEGFPLLTTRKLGLKTVAVEVEGYLKGITDKRWYQERGCHFWDNWCNPSQIPQELYLLDSSEQEHYRPISGDKKIQWQKDNPDLGCGYGYQLRNFGKRYKPIPFIWTGLDKSIVVNTSSTNKNVGRSKDSNYGPVTIIDFVSNKGYLIKFHNTGFSKFCSITDFESNHFSDPYSPTRSGVGCIGEYEYSIKKNLVKKLHNTWSAMIDRCYNPSNTAYHLYGGIGVYVSNDWLIFANYLRDVQYIEGWENKLNDWNGYQLDKDILSGYCYSKTTCLWVNKDINSNHTKQNYFFDAISPEGIIYKNNLGLRRFCKKHGLKTKNVEASLRNDTNTHNGWKFVRKQSFKYQSILDVGFDQLENLINNLRENPSDRRMVCSYWNPTVNNSKAIPECICLWNIDVNNGYLNLSWHQRSCDFVIGAPADIAHHALLLLLLCKETGYKPGILGAQFHDCHIYENHIETLNVQLDREPKELPFVSITNWHGLFHWTNQDIDIINYNPHDKLTYDIAI